MMVRLSGGRLINTRHIAYIGPEEPYPYPGETELVREVYLTGSRHQTWVAKEDFAMIMQILEKEEGLM